MKRDKDESKRVNIPRLVCDLLEKSGLSHADLGTEVGGTTETTISRWLNGHNVPQGCSLSMLLTVADKYGVDVFYDEYSQEKCNCRKMRATFKRLWENLPSEIPDDLARDIIKARGEIDNVLSRLSELYKH